MGLRNYRAYTMTEALAAVRADLGADAVIMHTRTFTQGGFLGIGRKSVIEVTAALANDVAPKSAPQSAPIPKQTPRTKAAIAAGAYRAASPVVVDPANVVAADLKPDRERTRLLAQAMAITLDRDRADSARSSASSAANANAAATTRAASEVASGSPAAAFVGATMGAHDVAQRYVLVPADRKASHVVTTAPVARRAVVESPRAASPVRDEPVDLDAIDRLVGDVLRRGGGAGAYGPPPGRLADVYAALVAQEIGKDLAAKIIDDIRASLTPEELASDHAVRSAAIERIGRLLPACGGLLPSGATKVDGGSIGEWRRNGRPLTVAFVGPTGVGKTTTVAKIAATLKLRHGARVGLVTCDTYRIAAVDQLRTYAEIIGVPLEVVLTPGQMRLATQKLRELDVVLIDTAGRSQNDVERIGELKAIVSAAEPHETHLVLSSVASEKALQREAIAFASVGIDKVVLTKLDEAAGLGAVIRVLREVGRSVSYITTGQEVPQHLESARPARLAELLLGPVQMSVGEMVAAPNCGAGVSGVVTGGAPSS